MGQSERGLSIDSSTPEATTSGNPKTDPSYGHRAEDYASAHNRLYVLIPSRLFILSREGDRSRRTSHRRRKWNKIRGCILGS